MEQWEEPSLNVHVFSIEPAPKNKIRSTKSRLVEAMCSLEIQINSRVKMNYTI